MFHLVFLNILSPVYKNQRVEYAVLHLCCYLLYINNLELGLLSMNSNGQVFDESLLMYSRVVELPEGNLGSDSPISLLYRRGPEK